MRWSWLRQAPPAYRSRRRARAPWAGEEPPTPPCVPRGERKEVHGQGAHDERRRQHPAARGVQATLPREEPGEEGEDEEAEVPDVEGLRGTPTVFEAQPEAVSYTHLTLPT